MLPDTSGVFHRPQFSPDGRLLVCEQAGTLRVIKNGALLTTPFVTLTVDPAGERGLIGVTDLLVQEARLRDTRRAAVDAWLDLREAEADVIEAIGATPW